MGLEPTFPKEADFKSAASANSATLPHLEYDNEALLAASSESIISQRDTLMCSTIKDDALKNVRFTHRELVYTG